MKNSACPNGSFSDFLAEILKGMGKGPHTATDIKKDCEELWPFRRNLNVGLISRRLKGRSDVIETRESRERSGWSRPLFQHVEVVG